MQAVRNSLKRPTTPSALEIEKMMENVQAHKGGTVMRTIDDTLRTYYSGFNLTALAVHIARSLAERE